MPNGKDRTHFEYYLVNALKNEMSPKNIGGLIE
jgi:hypothetical protein